MISLKAWKRAAGCMHSVASWRGQQQRAKMLLDYSQSRHIGLSFKSVKVGMVLIIVSVPSGPG